MIPSHPSPSTSNASEQQDYDMDDDTFSQPDSYVQVSSLQDSPMSNPLPGPSNQHALPVPDHSTALSVSDDNAKSLLATAEEFIGEATYLCCGIQYSDAAELVQHFEEVHIVPDRSGPIDSILPPLDHDLDSHLSARDTVAAVLNEDVDLPATSPIQNKSAVKRVGKPFKCPNPNCTKTYLQANGLKYHMTQGKCTSAPPESKVDPVPIPSPAPSDSEDEEHSSIGQPIPLPSSVDLEDEEPFLCGIGKCTNRYDNTSDLRFHYQISHVLPARGDSVGYINNVQRAPEMEAVDLTGKVTYLSRSHRGSSADIFVGRWEHTKVAIKAIHSPENKSTGKDKLPKRLAKEIRIRTCLRHPNVLPLLGTATFPGSIVSIIFPWMDEGDLAAYLDRKKNTLAPEARMLICEDVTNGLHYLHSQNVTHGGLTTSNVLIDGHGRAKLSDFGLLNVIADLPKESSTTVRIKGSSPRWAAPELFSTDDSVPEVNFFSDIYSLGSVILHVVSGEPPYKGLTDKAISLQNPPVRSKPPSIAADCWAIIQRCWDLVPNARPTAPEVGHMLALLQIPVYNRLPSR